VTLAVTLPERSGVILPCENNHKEGVMTTITATTPAHASTSASVSVSTDAARARRPERPWFRALVEALAYAGAAIDPAAALAATRLARLRDQELGRR
jgi:hypothetical protein